MQILLIMLWFISLNRYRRSPSRSPSGSRSLSRSVSPPVSRRGRGKRKYSRSRSRSRSRSPVEDRPRNSDHNRSRPSSIRSHSKDVDGNHASKGRRAQRSPSSSLSRSPRTAASRSLSPPEREVSKAKSDTTPKKKPRSPSPPSRSHRSLVSYGGGSPESHSK